MKIAVTELLPGEDALFERLFQLYLYDFSEFTEDAVAADGRYPDDESRAAWSSGAAQRFLARVNDAPAGFAMVKRGSVRRNDSEMMLMEEFFIMRKYRRSGAGEQLARVMFDRFPGGWQINEMHNNLPAQAFWRAVIARYTGGLFEEQMVDDDRWKGPIQFFDTRTPR